MYDVGLAKVACPMQHAPENLYLYIFVFLIIYLVNGDLIAHTFKAYLTSF